MVSIGTTTKPLAPDVFYTVFIKIQQALTAHPTYYLQIAYSKKKDQTHKIRELRTKTYLGKNYFSFNLLRAGMPCLVKLFLPQILKCFSRVSSPPAVISNGAAGAP